MPFTGPRAWKEDGIGPEERIDRFFNLIDHAVDGGIALSALYSRQHVKEFLLYTLSHSDAFYRNQLSTRKKDHSMSKLTLTSAFASTITIGDPGVLAFNLKPKETKSVEVDEAQLRHLTPGLERLKAAKWLNYTVTDGSSVPASVETKPAEPPAPPPPPPPEPVVPAADPVEEVSEEAPVEDPATPPVEVPPEVPVVVEPPVVQDVPPATDPAPSAPKSPLLERKNRNR
jgi:hypothetical protein